MGIVFAEPSDTNQDKDEECIRALEIASMFSDSRSASCIAKSECNQLPSLPHLIQLLKNDYTVKQFIYNYPPQLPLDDRNPSMVGSIIYQNTWKIHSESPASPSLAISTSACGDVQEYYYYNRKNGSSLEARYDREDFEKNRYDITNAIMQRHPPPAIQVNEFNILLNEIHCNDGLELYIRSNTQVCLKSQTYETMLERGFNLQQPIM